MLNARNAPNSAQAISIDNFAEEYLGLTVSYALLSSDGSICGLSAYTDTEYIIEEIGQKKTVPLKENQVLLNTSFIELRQDKALFGKRRFTLAHECAHKILFEMESDGKKSDYISQYSPNTAYSIYDLKILEDRNEWQANALGAAILMPKNKIYTAMDKFAHGRVLKNYEGKLSYVDGLSLSQICQAFEVSKTAAVIRLRHLGYIEDHAYEDYVDPLEISC